MPGTGRDASIYMVTFNAHQWAPEVGGSCPWLHSL